ncbi:hypothetical protein GRJ2_000608800 [Grus japonensis]|uniref:Uncharacterized protein n=1 Tax=Grus japonensis TaxID=30415 RepID=A0ABC9W795_GRUJA
MLQHLNDFHVMTGPKLNTVLEVQPHQSHVQEIDHVPSPAGHTVFCPEGVDLDLLTSKLKLELDRGNCTASSAHIHHRSLDDTGPCWIPGRYVKPAQVKMHTEDEQDDKKHQDDVASGIDQPHN